MSSNPRSVNYRDPDKAKDEGAAQARTDLVDKAVSATTGAAELRAANEAKDGLK